MPRDKSVGAALVLTFFFGPLGLLYSSVLGGFLMFVLSFISILLSAGLGMILIWPICMLWAALAASRKHSEFEAFLVGRPQQGGHYPGPPPPPPRSTGGWTDANALPPAPHQLPPAVSADGPASRKKPGQGASNLASARTIKVVGLPILGIALACLAGFIAYKGLLRAGEELTSSGAQEAGAIRGRATPDEVVTELFDAQLIGDRQAAAEVAAPRVVRALFNPPPERANPLANSLGDGPEPCIASEGEYVCYFRGSSVKVFVKGTPGHYWASWTMYPLGIGTVPSSSPAEAPDSETTLVGQLAAARARRDGLGDATDPQVEFNAKGCLPTTRSASVTLTVPTSPGWALYIYCLRDGMWQYDQGPIQGE